MASDDDIDMENLDEFMKTFVQGMDSGRMDIIDSLIHMKLKDPRSPIDINHCAVLASIRGNTTVLAKVLALKPRMAFEDLFGRRAIHYAAKNGHLECVRLLLKAGAISNCSDMFGRSPLHLACSSGHTDIVKLLVQQCAHINSCRSATGENALHVTAATSYIEVMKLLLDSCGEINAVTKENKGGDTPLHKAVAADKPDMVEYLCQRGAQANLPNTLGKCPIHIASEKGFLRCISVLIRHGASLEVTDSRHQTPLSSAIVHNQISVAKLLVEEGASVHEVDKHGYMPLHSASMRGITELIDYFVTAGADINARAPSTLHTPLMSAVSLGQLDAIHVLVALGADVTLPDAKGHTPLHLAHMKLGVLQDFTLEFTAGERKQALLDFFTMEGLPAMLDIEGPASLLDMEVKAGLGGAPVDEIIRALLEGGGRLDVRDYGNLTPLQRGIVVSVIRKVAILPWLQLLCQAGSHLGPDQFTMGKHSPLFWLAYSGLLNEALYLVRAGWDLNEETWIVLPGRDEAQDRLHRFMITTFKTVPSLLASCRTVLRCHLVAARKNREIISAVNLLPIPDPLKSFLKLVDIDAEDVAVLDPEV